MIVDHHAKLASLIARILYRNGFDTRIAPEPSLVLPYLQQHTPDLMILDLDIPNFSGIELLDQLHESTEYRHISVIAVTRNIYIHMNPGIERAALCLIKPVSTYELVTMAKRLLSGAPVSMRPG